jgi:putative tryptophan/tyrosine transport system substrate-binding protein
MKKAAVPSILIAVVLAVAVIAQAQQLKKVPRIGFLSGGGNPFSFEAFRQGLRNLGYIEGKTIVIEYRSAEGDQERIAGLVTELVQLKVDVLVITSSSGVRAAKQATKTIPVVILTQVDPVTAGLIDSLARPGGNLTGISSLSRDLSGKRLELLKEVLPKLSRVGVLWDMTDPTSANIGFKEYETAALAVKTQLQLLEVRGPNPDLEGAFQAAVKGRASALITIRNPLTNRYQKQIVDLAIKNRLPSMYERSDYVEAGGLVSYSSNDADNYRRLAYYVDRILKGTKPADLPMEQPMKFELVINLKTAKQIGVTIPPNVLARADKVIK